MSRNWKKIAENGGFLWENVPPALLFVAGMREKLYLCRFDSKKTKNGFMKMVLLDSSTDV